METSPLTSPLCATSGPVLWPTVAFDPNLKLHWPSTPGRPGVRDLLRYTEKSQMDDATLVSLIRHLTNYETPLCSGLDFIDTGVAMTIYGYARVSSADQNLDVQTEALRRAGCMIIREEKRSGSTRRGRHELETLLDFLRAGDTLVVTRIDRLARSIGDLQDIVRLLKNKGIGLRATDQPIDTGTAAGKAFLDMLGVFAEFETNLRRERQLEGIAQAKARGVYKGRRPSIDQAKIVQLHASGLGPTSIAAELKIARASVYRALAKTPSQE